MARETPDESGEKERLPLKRTRPTTKKAVRKKIPSSKKSPPHERGDSEANELRSSRTEPRRTASSAKKSRTEAGEVRPLDAREIKRIFSRPAAAGRKAGSRAKALTPPSSKKLWVKLAIIFGPSLVCLLLFFLVPGMQDMLFGVPREEKPAETNLLPSKYDSLFLSPTLFLSNQIVAYYGHPQNRWMGIVGRHSKERLAELLTKTAQDYDRLNGSKKTVPAFYLIWGSVQPRGEIQFMNKHILDSYIKYTATNGYLLILDHQIGKYGPRKAVEQLLPFLRYPHVHLAIDPEWRTLRPMQEIGYVTGEEINQVQALMRTYMLTNRIPGKRMLIVHQFENKMLVQRHQIRTLYDPVVFVHSVSGWGSPSMKLGTWNRHRQATNLPHKAFKLWYYPGVQRPGLHYDYPLMSHQAVLALRPAPLVIIYQ